MYGHPRGVAQVRKVLQVGSPFILFVFLVRCLLSCAQEVHRVLVSGGVLAWITAGPPESRKLDLLHTPDITWSVDTMVMTPEDEGASVPLRILIGHKP